MEAGRKRTFIFLFIVNLIFLREGFFSNDEGADYLLIKSISENFPHFLNLSQYIKMPVGYGPYYSFFHYNGGIHAATYMGFPLLASPFYSLFGMIGIELFNVLATILTAYIVFLIVNHLYGKKYAILGAVLYTFITPSLFYSSSLWYQPAVTLFFAIFGLQFFKLEDNPRDVLLLSLSGAFTVLCSYYMIIPVSIAIVFILFKLPARLKFISIASFTFFLIPAFVYNYANFGSSLLGKYGIPAVVYTVAGYSTPAGTGLFNEINRIISGLVKLLISANSSYTYSFAQKALFQSSPVLALGFLYPLMKRNYRFSAFFITNLVLILMVAYSGGDFGGWELNMRYIMPVFPFLVVSLIGFLNKFKINFNLKLLCSILFVETIVLLLFPIGIYSKNYFIMKLIASFAGLALLFTGIMFSRVNRNILKAVLITAIIFSAFININDASYGASYRSADSFIVNSLNLNKEKVVFPTGTPLGGLFLPGKLVYVYKNDSDIRKFLKGNLTAVVKKDFNSYGECKVTHTRYFDNFYYYGVRVKNLKKTIEYLGNYKIVDINC